MREEVKIHATYQAGLDPMIETLKESKSLKEGFADWICLNVKAYAPPGRFKVISAFFAHKDDAAALQANNEIGIDMLARKVKEELKEAKE